MDYNIYIHDKTSGTQKPTEPKPGGGDFTAAKTQNNQSLLGFGSMADANVGKMLSSAATGLAVIAVVKKAIEITDKVVGVVEPFITRETGDYRFNVAYGNAKALFNTVTNPRQAVMNYLTYQQELRIYNRKREQEALLIGESYTNSSSRKI